MNLPYVYAYKLVYTYFVNIWSSYLPLKDKEKIVLTTTFMKKTEYYSTPDLKKILLELKLKHRLSLYIS